MIPFRKLTTFLEIDHLMYLFQKRSVIFKLSSCFKEGVDVFSYPFEQRAPRQRGLSLFAWGGVFKRRSRKTHKSRMSESWVGHD